MAHSVKLKHGWIGVVNRGQADINSRVRHMAACLFALQLLPSSSQACAVIWRLWLLASRQALPGVLHSC